MFRSPVPSVNCKLFNFSECYISIHVPIAGNDWQCYGHSRLCQEFQSTFPLQGTTSFRNGWKNAMKNFNPRSHCRERRSRGGTFYYSAKISIHVPIAGNDIFGCPARSNAFSFQSTFPLQGTTLRENCNGTLRVISIHVPIAGNDVEESGRS